MGVNPPPYGRFDQVRNTRFNQWNCCKNVTWSRRQSLIGWLICRFLLFEEAELVADTGNIVDKTHQGGRLGVYCFSQENIIWSDLVYRCNGKFSTLTGHSISKLIVENQRYFKRLFEPIIHKYIRKLWKFNSWKAKHLADDYKIHAHGCFCIFPSSFSRVYVSNSKLVIMANQHKLNVSWPWPSSSQIYNEGLEGRILEYEKFMSFFHRGSTTRIQNNRQIE